jgi:choline kinase/2-phospho-L-lactate transferase/gluconeogenesis factor (CofD/UPF0052 family)
MNITIVTGGSGSLYIQEGLDKLFPFITLNLIINGYDDGKSTGTLRKLFPNSLGISDFRKNQLLEFKLKNGNNEIYKLLNLRFTIDNYKAKEYLINYINKSFLNYNNEFKNLKIFLFDNLNYFFSLEQSSNIIYDDFSFMNIIYCSLLHQNDNNMEIVCYIIKNNLNLKNNIYLNSNENLILKAKTKNNIILENEEQIVNFGKNYKDDKIIDTFFNENKFPILNKNTEDILLKSDIILFSCGTQFSSLIPTYKTNNFNRTIQKSMAKKYLVLNSDYDYDINNYSGDELLNKINEYLLLDNIKIIFGDNYNKNLIPTNTKFKYINIPLLLIDNNKKHNGFILWNYIFRDYFYKFINNNYIFDYDYTLYSPDNNTISLKNLNILENLNNKFKNCSIISNNDYDNIININNIDIYSNIGNLLNNKEVINKEYFLSEDEILYFNNIFNKLNCSKNIILTNRKFISISLKPIIDRDSFINEVNKYIDNNNYKLIKTGKTTIEFLKKKLTKRCVFNTLDLIKNSNTYISDLNDINYTPKDDLKFLHVDNILTTNIFLNTINNQNKYDFCIIVGGINKRMNIDYPKSLVIIDNQEILFKIINNIKIYANNIYICGNNFYKEKFESFNKKYNFDDNIKFLYFNSLDNNLSYPKGNGETIYQILNDKYNLTSNFFILWGDIFFTNNKIIEEIYNYDLQNKSDILIPVIKENDPYAYLILDDNNNVTNIEYKKIKPIDNGYHDQCIFLCNKNSIKTNIENILNYNDKDEINFLDIISYLPNVNYFETPYKVNSFNSQNDLKNII